MFCLLRLYNHARNKELETFGLLDTTYELAASERSTDSGSLNHSTFNAGADDKPFKNSDWFTNNLLAENQFLKDCLALVAGKVEV